VAWVVGVRSQVGASVQVYVPLRVLTDSELALESLEQVGIRNQVPLGEPDLPRPALSS